MARPAARGPDLLRFLTCGSVDDGKSTLIGRLLFEAHAVLDDQLAALERDSQKAGRGGEPDLSLLVDGLEAEREQGITIDVAYRSFATGRRTFTAIDAPGHEQYTRNMATGASNADAAVLLVDARKGVLEQTRRHSYICSLFGIRHVALVVNKMDLVGYSQEVFERIAAEYAAFATSLQYVTVTSIPVSALQGANVAAPSAETSWYAGPALLQYLESLEVLAGYPGPFRFPVQSVVRPHPDERGLAGTVESGRIGVGDAVVVAPSGQRSRVARIFDGERDLPEAQAGSAVTLHLSDELDVSRGDILGAAEAPPTVSDEFAAHLLWMSREPLLPGRSYLMRMGTAWTPASVTGIQYRMDIRSFQPVETRQLAMNEIGFCALGAGRRLAFDSYAENRATGSFILVDRVTNETAAAGLVDYALQRTANNPIEALLVDREARAAMKSQRPAAVWFTGLSGSGKSTIAKELERQLYLEGYHTYVLDGDNLRHGLNRDLGFTVGDRVENIRRAGEMARLMTEAGLIVICSFISPFRAERQVVRDLFPDVEFMEVFVDAPLEVCMRRDPKGLYAKAKAGLLPNFTGIDSPYEAPGHPELVLRTDTDDLASEVRAVIARLRERGVIDSGVA